jgi:hypothetical protein
LTRVLIGTTYVVTRIFEDDNDGLSGINVLVVLCYAVLGYVMLCYVCSCSLSRDPVRCNENVNVLG